MLAYWLLFLVPAYWALSRLRPLPNAAENVIKQNRWPTEWRCIFFVLVLMIGMRHEVGGDWAAYIHNMENSEEFAEYADPANQILFW